MTGEYWQKIQAIRQDMSEKEKEATGAVELERQKRKESIEAVSSIFEDIRLNDPQIQAEPLSVIKVSAFDGKSVVELRWGEKFSMSEEDHNAMRAGRVNQMVAHNYNHVNAEIDARTISFPHTGILENEHYVDRFRLGDAEVIDYETFSLDKFLTDPSIVLPTVTRLLERPLREAELYTRDRYPNMFGQPTVATTR